MLDLQAPSLPTSWFSSSVACHVFLCKEPPKIESCVRKEVLCVGVWQIVSNNCHLLSDLLTTSKEKRCKRGEK